VPPQNDIDFLKIFSWENILVKSSYYEKGKKRRKKEKKGEKENITLFSSP